MGSASGGPLSRCKSSTEEKLGKEVDPNASRSFVKSGRLDKTCLKLRGWSYGLLSRSTELRGDLLSYGTGLLSTGLRSTCLGTEPLPGLGVVSAYVSQNARLEISPHRSGHFCTEVVSV